MFITFEGIEGAGKTTQVNLLAEYFKKKGEQVITTHEPGGTKTGQKIRNIILENQKNSLQPLTELLLFCADRREHVAQTIKPALISGKTVICDRFTDSSLAYQVGGHGLDERLVQFLNSQTTDGLIPDITFFLDIPPAISKKRKAISENLNSYDFLGENFFTRVRQYFLKLVLENPDRIVIINGLESIQVIRKKICDIINYGRTNLPNK